MDTRDFFEEKERYLSSYFPCVSASDFYNDLFPSGSFETETGHQDKYLNTKKGNGFIVYQSDDKKMHTRFVFDGLEEIKKHMGFSMAFMSPISYFGRNRTAANARLLFALVFDLDGVSDGELSLFFGWYVDKDRLPNPTYIVNSGGGVHLYYVFETPIPMYPNIQKQLKNLKYELTDKIWNIDTSSVETKQYQGINQGFRLVGSKTKNGKTVTAYKTGDRVTLEYLSYFVSEKNKITDVFYHPKLTLEEARKKYPEWYEQRIVQGRKRMNWTCRRNLYDWWKGKCYEVKFHHRYFYIMCLAVYAIKCGIAFEELKKDAYGFLEYMNHVSRENPFTEYDIESALEMYQECYRSFPRDDISKVSGIEIKPNRRNGRPQKLHLEIARANQAIMDKYNGLNWRKGNGRKDVEKDVYDFLIKNPSGTAKEFCETTGLSRPVFYKYKKILKEEHKI